MEYTPEERNKRTLAHLNASAKFLHVLANAVSSGNKYAIGSYIHTNYELINELRRLLDGGEYPTKWGRGLITPEKMEELAEEARSNYS